MTKSRIDYIDLLKGFAMIMVIIHHCEAGLPDWLYTPLRTFRQPLFFFIAGIFMSDRLSPVQYILKKCNRLLVPAIFFSIVLMALSGLFSAISISYQSASDNYLTDKAYQIYRFILDPANLPTWFLWCMFSATVIFYWLLKIADRKASVMAIASVCLAASGLILIQGHASVCYGEYCALPVSSVLRFIYRLHMPEALAMQPVIFAGYYFASKGIDGINLKPLHAIAVSTICLLILCGSLGVSASLYYHVWPWYIYIFSFAGITLFVIIARRIAHISVINYIGRYSLTALCTHYIYIILLTSLFPDIFRFGWPLAAAVVALTFLFIYPLKRWLPWFTGQADLIRRPQRLPRFFSAAKS